jgi:pimeloyl-ACP methyl ester carboxylesterase
MEHIDPLRFAVQYASPRGFRQAYVREGVGGVPLLCVHGWPETKRIFWKVIEPLAAAGFEVIVPDLRSFGDSEVAPDGFGDVPSHARDLYALVHDHLGHDRVVLVGGDLGGPVVQDLALRHPEWVDRMVLFNSPLPYLKDAMAGIPGTRAPREAADYSSARATTPTGWRPNLPHPSSVAATSPPSTPVASGRIPVRSPVPERSTSTLNRSPTQHTCGRASVATKARSTSRRAANRAC